MTLQKAAGEALACQDACNSSGIARSMVEAMDAIRKEPHSWMENGTRVHSGGLNTHPIVFMFLYKLMALAGHEPLNLWDEYSEAEKACQAIAAEVALTAPRPCKCGHPVEQHGEEDYDQCAVTGCRCEHFAVVANA